MSFLLSRILDVMYASPKTVSNIFITRFVFYSPELWIIVTKDSSWEGVHQWYNRTVGQEGHYYHRHVILPNVLRLMKKPGKVLDLGCGQGVLARHLPTSTAYCGLDASKSLIAAAKHQASPQHTFLLQDVLQPFTLPERDFTHAVILLALQNMASPLPVLQNAAHHLKAQGSLIIVLNHPCFRIPRQSGWQIDEKKKIQSRRVDRYMSPLEIPIQAHPGQVQDSSSSISFHLPLSAYSQALKGAGFLIETIEEWCSDKISTGKAARMENRAREEFPLFLAIAAVKK